MKYTKPPLSFEEQAKLLLDRGLLVTDETELLKYLSTVNYYRLSGYLYPFKQIDPVTGKESFFPDTKFSTIVKRYEFDRKLRLLLMDAIERIEVAILRTQFVEKFTLTYGTFGYTEHKNFKPEFPRDEFRKSLEAISFDEKRSSEEFIKRYRSKYNEEPFLAFWMAAEIMSFGQLYTLYKYSHREIQILIAKKYDLPAIVLDSWLLTLLYIRNACAHHVRIWNRVLPVPPLFPDKKNDPNWYEPVVISNKRIFAVLTIIFFGNLWGDTGGCIGLTIGGLLVYLLFMRKTTGPNSVNPSALNVEHT